jgi:hypothetical protein
MYFAASSSTRVVTPGSCNLINKSFSDLTISAGDLWRLLPPKRKAIVGLLHKEIVRRVLIFVWTDMLPTMDVFGGKSTHHNPKWTNLPCRSDGWGRCCRLRRSLVADEIS